MSFLFVELKFILLFAVVAVNCVPLTNSSDSKYKTVQNANMSVDEQFLSWKAKYNKAYTSPEEEQRRKQLWLKAKQKIEEHNEKYARGETTFTMGLNHFADLEPHEIPRGLALRNN